VEPPAYGSGIRWPDVDLGKSDYLPSQERFFGLDDVKKSGAIGPGVGAAASGASGTGRGPKAIDGAEPEEVAGGTAVNSSSEPRESMSFAIFTVVA
jgi:hypothetical protein